ncbi:hypothetical protein GGU11DRAFT_691140, partial [Lentinula aff. detonsa]
FTLINNCPYSITAYVEDTKCGYSPRCADASSYSAAQPGAIPAGGTMEVTIPAAWVGRIYAETSTFTCGAKGEDCTIGEFNLDTGDFYAAQAYDISNIQGFTQAMAIQLQGCDTVTCSSQSCACSDAYPPGDETGCGDDSPVRSRESLCSSFFFSLESIGPRLRCWYVIIFPGIYECESLTMITGAIPATITFCP